MSAHLLELLLSLPFAECVKQGSELPRTPAAATHASKRCGRWRCVEELRLRGWLSIDDGVEVVF